MTVRNTRSSSKSKVEAKANVSDTKSPARKVNFVVASPIRTPKKYIRKKAVAENSNEISPGSDMKVMNPTIKQSENINVSQNNISFTSNNLEDQDLENSLQPSTFVEKEISIPEENSISSCTPEKKTLNEITTHSNNESSESDSESEGESGIKSVSESEDEINKDVSEPETELSEDESKLNELLAQARKNALSSDFSIKQKKTKPFIQNGKFFDPYSEAVQKHLYIQNVSEYTQDDDDDFVPLLRPVTLNSSLIGLSVLDDTVGSHLLPNTTDSNVLTTSGSKASQLVEHETALVNSNLAHALNTIQSKGLEKLRMQRELPKYPRTKAELAKDKASNAGSSWFNMPAPDMTPELKRDLELLSLRNVLDRKRFYKKSDKVASKFLQVGTIVEDKSEFFSSRIARRDRRSTIVGEVLHDAETQSYLTSKYNELQASSIKNGRRKSTNNGYFKKNKKPRRK